MVTSDQNFVLSIQDGRTTLCHFNGKKLFAALMLVNKPTSLLPLRWILNFSVTVTVKPGKPGKPGTPEFLLECYCGARKKPIRHEKTKLQARTLISLWFVACSHVLIFAEIGRNTINIPEIFQVFKVFPVPP